MRPGVTLGSFDWTPKAIAKLRKLWVEGLSTAAIGREIGVSKNSIISKAHRLRLAGRADPIHRTGVPAKPKPPVSVREKPTLAPLFDAPLLKPAPVKVTFRPGPCQWPSGDKPVRFDCTELTSGNKPYCARHAAVAFVRVRDRREDVAA